MITHHAQKRMQQRGVCYETLDLILSFGDESVHWGAFIYKAIRKVVTLMIKSGVPIALAERCKGKYAVVQDGMVLTVAHITCRHAHK